MLYLELSIDDFICIVFPICIAVAGWLTYVFPIFVLILLDC